MGSRPVRRSIEQASFIEKKEVGSFFKCVCEGKGGFSKEIPI